MIKVIIIAETVTSGVIWRVDVNEFDLSAELLFEGVEGDEVIAFDDKVFANCAVVIALDVRYVLFTVDGVAFPVREDFRIEHSVDFVLREGFVEENLLALLLFRGLPALQHTVFVGPNERNLAAFTEKFVSDVQADFVPELRVGVGEEIFVGDVADEGIVVEDPMPVNLVKECRFYFVVSEQQFDKVIVESPCVVSNGGGDEFVSVIKEVGMGFEEGGQFFVEFLFRHIEPFGIECYP